LEFRLQAAKRNGPRERETPNEDRLKAELQTKTA